MAILPHNARDPRSLGRGGCQYLLLVLACFLWGGTPLSGKILSGSVSPLLITSARFAVVSATLFGYLALSSQLREIFKIDRRSIFIMFLMGVVGIGMHNSVMFSALHYTTASNTALIESVGPAITTILAFFIIGEKLSAKGWLGILVSCFGTVFIVAKGSLTSLAHLDFNKGDLMVILSEAMWSFYVVISWKLNRGVKIIAVTAVTGLFGSLFCFGVGLACSGLEIYSCETKDVLAFLYLTFFAGILAFLCWNYGVAKVGVSKSGAFVYLVPVFGAAMGVFILNEDFFIADAVGGALVVFGMMITVRAKSSMAKGRVEKIASELVLKKKPNP